MTLNHYMVKHLWFYIKYCNMEQKKNITRSSTLVINIKKILYKHKKGKT